MANPEITPEMIRAGKAEADRHWTLLSFLTDTGTGEACRAIYTAMRLAGEKKQ